MLITVGARLSIIGDSITDTVLGYPWHIPLWGMIRAAFQKTSQPASGSSARGWSSPSVTTWDSGKLLGYFAIGDSSGATIATINTHISSLPVTTTHLIYEGGLNDVQQSVPPSTSATNLTAGLDACLVQCPNLVNSNITVLEPCIKGELWSAGPPPVLSGNALDASIPATATAMQNVATGRGCTWAPTRAALALAESIYNTPAPGVASGILTNDGAHLLLLGAQVISQAVFATMTFP